MNFQNLILYDSQEIKLILWMILWITVTSSLNHFTSGRRGELTQVFCRICIYGHNFYGLMSALLTDTHFEIELELRIFKDLTKYFKPILYNYPVYRHSPTTF